MTSRPISSFVSYSGFSVFDIQPLDKKQAIDLIRKLEFWDEEAKQNFIEALDSNLYYSHREFAGNPLLLTIMLMTYTSYGEVPAKMHVFYAKAYETMARLHDATKGSFKRPFHTGLTPDEFAKYFAQFCARTYRDEKFEFDSSSFTAYMKKVLNKAEPGHKGIGPQAFLLDLTDNLCIMYREGEKYYFIHRSFQEYFAARHFASMYDEDLYKVGLFFEHKTSRSYSDRTFDMLYDMIPEKVERFIFLPFLEKLIPDCLKKGDDGYWEFLERMYSSLFFNEGDVGDPYLNDEQSFNYLKIIDKKDLAKDHDLDQLKWPESVHRLSSTEWVSVYEKFTSQKAFDEYPDPDLIPESDLEEMTVIEERELPSSYDYYFGFPDVVGETYEIDIYMTCGKGLKDSRISDHSWKNLSSL